MAKKKSSILINTLVLVLVTFVAILALAVVNQITLEPIKQAEINARAEIYKVVYPSAPGFKEIDNTKELLEKAPEMLSQNGLDGCSINDVLAVTSASGDIEGYVIAATSPSGYGGDIQIAVGIKDGKLTGFDVVSNSETAGLGTKCTEPDFKNQFAGKSASLLEYTKSGASNDNEIDAISGATITSGAVTEATNSAIMFYQENFGGGIKESVELYTVDNAEETADGYKITVTTNKGFAGNIQLAVEIDKSATITAFQVLASNETEGYGAVCTSEDYAKQFVGLKADAVSTVASGAKTENNEVDAISGATYTTKAVEIAVNGAIMYYQENYGGGLSDSLKEKAESAESEADVTAGASVKEGA